LHVVVPLVPACDWGFARAWSRTFAENLERARPDLYVASVPKARRRGKILIDWLRNGLGSTAIASFSPRARPHATVAVPVTWREVAEKLDPQGFTVHSVPGRLTKLRSDPWAGFNTTKQKLVGNTERKRKHG
jgi:bifunctional non-homologous end joining protein LigD